jgi:hypothetical protein
MAGEGIDGTGGLATFGATASVFSWTTVSVVVAAMIGSVAPVS